MEKHEQDILVGSILGDGWLNALTKDDRASFQLKYNDKSLRFLKWVKHELRALGPQKLKVIQKYSQHYFRIPSRHDIGQLRQLFYPNEGIKRVPQNIGELLDNPLSLAIWYQDDGTLDRRSRYHWNAMFATYCFPYRDCVLLANTVKRNFGIEMSVCRCQMRGKMYYRLYVPAKSMERFIKTVQPHIHPDFAYKVLAL
ncbi:MAG: hypothetical protein Q8P33_02220 [bacterium]|nr:hypothetical protein [bacterium]